MIKHIILSLVFACLLLAISIKVFNPDITYVSLGKPFLSFLKSCSMDLQDYKIEIPSIPSIPYVSDLSGFEFIVNAFVSFVNGISTLLNFVVTILNIIIQLLQFIFIILRNAISLRDTLLNA